MRSLSQPASGQYRSNKGTSNLVGTGLAPVRKRVKGTLQPVRSTRATVSRTGASPVPTAFLVN